MTRYIKIVKPLQTTPVLLDRPLSFLEKFTHRQKVKLTAEFQLDFCGTLFSVPEGFEFDNASCPRVFNFLLSDESLKGYGAALHDWLYHAGYPKCTADGMFRDVLSEIDKARTFDHCVMWLAVAFFGRSAYALHRKREKSQPN